MYLSQKIGANLVRFVTSVHVANIFKVSNICKSPQKTCMHLQERTKTRRRSTSKIWGFSEKSYKAHFFATKLLITIQFGNFSNHKDSIYHYSVQSIFRVFQGKLFRAVFFRMLQNTQFPFNSISKKIWCHGWRIIF